MHLPASAGSGAACFKQTAALQPSVGTGFGPVSNSRPCLPAPPTPPVWTIYEFNGPQMRLDTLLLLSYPSFHPTMLPLPEFSPLLALQVCWYMAAVDVMTDR